MNFITVTFTIALCVGGSIQNGLHSVLNSNAKVILVDRDASGNLLYDSWSPTSEERQAIHERVLNNNRVPASPIELVSDKADFINLGQNLTFSGKAEGDVIVETVIVCDKEWGDVLQHDRQRILEYWSIYFWDLNLRYKTLPSSNVSFRITSIVVVVTTLEQPFIEDARAEDGRAEFGRILGLFKRWIYERMNNFPKFDIAVVVTNTALEWGGGLAHVGGACFLDHDNQYHYGTGVWNDNVAWGSLTVGTHEIGHIVGAPHDDDPNFPGGCEERGYIMGGGNDDFRWFFSNCSDRTIGDFVRSDQASCLRQIDEEGDLPINPDFGHSKSPTMLEQCKARLNNPNATIEERDTDNCKVMRCLVPFEDGGGWWIHNLHQLDDTPCLGGGRCFRGRCLRNMTFIQNVKTQQCIHPEVEPFAITGTPRMGPCSTEIPRPPQQQFQLLSAEENEVGKFLVTSYMTPPTKQSGDKCLQVSPTGIPRFMVCSEELRSYILFNVYNATVENNEFWIIHRLTGNCLIHDESTGLLGSSWTCQGSTRWKFI